MSTEMAPIVDATTVERVLLHGDLQKLTSSQKVSYYRAVCESVGLNPLTQPFQYLVLNGKEILYARREATEQLRQLHQVSITIVGRELVDDIYVVTARATLPGGRTDENIGAVPLAGLKGDAKANNMMKAETKAKRRVTLAICGLGLLDETEVADIPAAAKGPLPPGDGPQPVSLAPEPPLALDEPDLPPGFVRIQEVTSAPTKNPSVTRYSITLSTGEVVTTINEWVATLAQNYQTDQTPVQVVAKQTRWGSELIGLKTTEPELPIEPPPLDRDQPF